MPSQLGNCNCCKCDDCRCKVILYKCGGSWAPAPTVKCGRNSVSGRFVFENSADCGGCKCCVQEGCTVSKICLDKTYVFKFRVYGHLETSRAGMHIGEIYYRKICCNGKKKSWKRVVHVESEGGGLPCCKSRPVDVCKIKLARGKYEFKFKANSVDGLDHCGNFLQYDVKWCKNVIGKSCCPTLPGMEEVSDFCCSVTNNPCCPPPTCIPLGKCNQEDPSCDECPPGCGTDPCVAHGWIIIPCDSVNLA
jgi:hypothetical protein